VALRIATMRRLFARAGLEDGAVYLPLDEARQQLKARRRRFGS
jgi:hypothetical protein